ncbi:penicillin acylase family protein, partial [Bacteroidota bacterium]
LPIRPSHVNSKFILDGSSGEDDYLGFYDFTSNPQSENPPGGIVYSANNQPDSIEGILYPGYYCPENRAARIVSLLAEKEKWDSGDFREMMLDDISNTILKNTNELIRIISEGISDSDEFKLYIDILKDWSSSHGKNQIAPTIYYKWLYYILESTMADELGVDRTLFLYNNTFLIKNSFPGLISNDHSVWWDNVNTKDKTETREDIIIQALHKTIENLQADRGTDVNEWTWGNIHKLEHVHPVGMQEPFDKIYNVGPFGTWGGSEVINYLNVKMADSKEFSVTFGPSARRIIDFGNIELTENILPTGQSGHFMSDYYDDQAELYNQGEFRKQRMNRDDILSNASATFILDPVK